MVTTNWIRKVNKVWGNIPIPKHTTFLYSHWFTPVGVPSVSKKQKVSTNAIHSLNTAFAHMKLQEIAFLNYFFLGTSIFIGSRFLKSLLKSDKQLWRANLLSLPIMYFETVFICYLFQSSLKIILKQCNAWRS